jgi:polysaccharide pyruvyl transferase WcaK-like protein
VKVGVVAWVGSDNLGDEILLSALISGVRAAREDASFLVFGADPSRVAELHPVQAMPMPTLRGGGATGRQRAVRRAIQGCDLLFFGPGTVFQERSPNLRWPGTLVLLARTQLLARLAGTPVALVGVGVREGGTAAGRAALRLIGAASTAAGARDRRSATYLGRSTRVIGDLAYALPLPQVPPRPPGRRFALSLRPLGTAAEPVLVASVRRCLDRLVAEGWSGSFLPMALGSGARGEDDRASYEQHFRDLMGAVPNPLSGPGPLAGALQPWLCTLAGYHLVIAARLHAALMAVALGVPTVAIAYERKVRDALGDLGLGGYVTAPDAGPEVLYRTVQAAVAAPEEFREAAARIAAQGATARGFIASVLERVG